MQACPDSRPGLPRSVGVIGGGTAGYLAALAIKRRFPGVSVTVVESKDIPVIGVGEATTALMPSFLHSQLGIGVLDLFREVNPTFKLGIRFEWGQPGEGHAFNYPFGDISPIEAAVYDGHLTDQSLSSMLMSAGRGPVLRGPEGELVSLLPEVKFAYHLDNAPFVSFLARVAARSGVLHEQTTIEGVVPLEGRPGIGALCGRGGKRLGFDLYIDASGFRSMLLEAALGSPFISYASSLFCDQAVVGELPHGGEIRPYTTAETMDAGWCWRIPVRDEDHRGYVFSSSFLDRDAAEAEFRAKNPALGETRTVRFRSGRHRDFWSHNVVGIGNAYAFVEPLESTALHMVIVEIAYLLAGLEAMALPGGAPDYPAFASEALGAHWDYLRWFLALHYRFNHRLETPFWRAARSEVDMSGLAPFVDRFQAEGPGHAPAGGDFRHGDADFGFKDGALVMLLGQGLSAPLRARSGISRAQWTDQVDRRRGVVRWSLPHAQALDELHAHPELLSAFETSPRSWLRSDAERVAALPLGGLGKPRGPSPRP